MRRELKEVLAVEISKVRAGRKAHPDEKGTESSVLNRRVAHVGEQVAKHIPMRRELKELGLNGLTIKVSCVAKHIPMRRELKDSYLKISVSGNDTSQSTSR